MVARKRIKIKHYFFILCLLGLMVFLSFSMSQSEAIAVVQEQLQTPGNEAASAVDNSLGQELSPKEEATKTESPLEELISPGERSSKNTEIPVGELDESENLQPSNSKTDGEKLLLPDGFYTIACSQNNDLVLDVAAASASNGTPIKLWKKNGQSNQSFFIHRDPDGSYRIIPCHSYKVIAAAGVGAKQGTSLVQWDDNKTRNMRWAITSSLAGGYTIASLDTGMLFDYAADSPATGVDLVVWGATGSLKQTFLFMPSTRQHLTKQSIAGGVYAISCSENDAQVIDIGYGCFQNGAKASLEENQNKLNQKYFISFVTVIDDYGYYTLRPLNSGKILAVAGIKAKNGTSVVQWDNNHTSNMQWVIAQGKYGGFIIASLDTDMVLDYAADFPCNDADIVVWQRTESQKQEFNLIKVPVLEDGYYAISPVSDNSLRIDVNGGSLDDDINTILWSINGGLSQKFLLTQNSDGSYQVKAQHSGKNLALSINGKIIQTSVDSYSQKWFIVPDGYGGFRVSSDDAGTSVFTVAGHCSSSASVVGTPAASSQNQSFLFSHTDLIDNGMYSIGSVLDSSFVFALSSSSLSDGETFYITKKSSSARQLFAVTNENSGVIRLDNYLSGKTLGVSGESSRGSRIIQKTYDGSLSMLWQMIPTYTGSVYLKNLATGMNLDFASDILMIGVPLVVWDAHCGEKQKFVFYSEQKPPFKLYIDAGHGWNSTTVGYFDPGAIGNMFQESSLTSELAEMVANKCNANGVAAVTNAYATSETGVPYTQRQSQAFNLNCTTFVSIHFNAGGGSGVESYIHSVNPPSGSAELQSIMHRALVAASGLPDRGKYSMGLAVCGGPLPSTLLEVGFIDNSYDMFVYQNNKAILATFLAGAALEAQNTPICNVYNSYS